MGKYTKKHLFENTRIIKMLRPRERNTVDHSVPDRYRYIPKHSVGTAMPQYFSKIFPDSPTFLQSTLVQIISGLVSPSLPAHVLP